MKEEGAGLLKEHCSTQMQRPTNNTNQQQPARTTGEQLLLGCKNQSLLQDAIVQATSSNGYQRGYHYHTQHCVGRLLTRRVKPAQPAAQRQSKSSRELTYYKKASLCVPGCWLGHRLAAEAELAVYWRKMRQQSAAHSQHSLHRFAALLLSHLWRSLRFLSTKWVLQRPNWHDRLSTFKSPQQRGARATGKIDSNSATKCVVGEREASGSYLVAANAAVFLQRTGLPALHKVTLPSRRWLHH